MSFFDTEEKTQEENFQEKSSEDYWRRKEHEQRQTENDRNFWLQVGTLALTAVTTIAAVVNSMNNKES